MVRTVGKQPVACQRCMCALKKPAAPYSCALTIIALPPRVGSQLPLRHVLKGRQVTLLKIDIDSTEGNLLHKVTQMLHAGETSVESILIELGPFDVSVAGCDVLSAKRCEVQPRPWFCGINCSLPKASPNIRGGNLDDLYALQHELEYDTYRIKIDR